MKQQFIQVVLVVMVTLLTASCAHNTTEYQERIAWLEAEHAILVKQLRVERQGYTDEEKKELEEIKQSPEYKDLVEKIMLLTEPEDLDEIARYQRSHEEQKTPDDTQISKISRLEEEDVISYSDFIDVLVQVESGGDNNAVGDNGKAVGPLQIHPIMVADVNRIVRLENRRNDLNNSSYLNRKTVYTLKDRTDRWKSQSMASIYFSHYCREHLIPYNWEALARAWNAGPDWEQNKKATDAYWEKVRKLLVQKRQDIVDAHGAVAEGTEEVPEK